MKIERHFVLNKPYGFISQFVSKQRYAHKKKYLGELFNFPAEAMAIGRLDENSEGLLLITTDGMMSEQVRSNKIEKEYWVQVDGRIDELAIEKLNKGVEIKIEGKVHKSIGAIVKRIEQPTHLPPRSKAIRSERHGPTSWISIVITEGKFRQVRKMTASVGFPTLRLIRYRIGGICLDLSSKERCKEIDLELMRVALDNKQRMVLL